MKEDLLNELRRPTADERFIYHYTKHTTAIEHILLKGELRFNCLQQMNDPLEFQKWSHFWHGEANVHDGLDVQMIHTKGGRVMEILKQHIRICCFCIDCEPSENTIHSFPTNKGYYRSRMWSQYGASHSGVCLVFDKEKLIGAVKPTDQDVYRNKIVYDDALPGQKELFDINIDTEKNFDPLQRVKDNIYT
jgi:hypothetical protein